jgi:energy-coupling factor transporter ATP-binding protein EcfA2
MIKLSDFSYRYPSADTWALNQINLEIPQGQFVGIVGANGAGKSTLCYALSGFAPHFYRGKTQGSLAVNQTDVLGSSLGDLAGEIGLVFQNPFNQISGARYTVREEIAFGLENLGMPPAEIRQRVDEILAQSDLTELADRSPFALSGGQQQRVAIAAIMAMQPGVLVLDEPTSQLDPHGTQEVFASLDALTQQRAATVVLASHKLEWLAAFCDRVLVLDQGRVVADGEPASVLADAALPVYGIGGTRYTLAARAAQQSGLVSAKRALPVTLDQAKDFFQ